MNANDKDILNALYPVFFYPLFVVCLIFDS